MNDATNWTTTSAYTELDAEANDKGGDLNANGDACKRHPSDVGGGCNGIDR